MTCSSSTRRRRFRPRSGPHDGRVVHFSTRVARRRRIMGRRAAHAVRRRERSRTSTARPGDRVELEGGGGSTARAASPTVARPGSGLPPRIRRPVLDYLASHGRPIRYGCTDSSWPIDAYQTVFGDRPGQRRDAERGTRVHPRARRPPRRQGRRDRADHAAYGCVVPGGARAAVRRVVPGAAPTAERVNAAHDAGPRGGRDRDDRRRAPSRRSPARTAAPTPAKAGPTSSSPPSVACGRSTGCSPAGTSLRRHTCSCSKPSRGGELLDRSYDAALGLGYRWHEFGDPHLIVP